MLAMDENSVIFKIVSFAWAGFGATFGPLMILSLFWKRVNRAGAVAGMVAGAGMVFLWKLVISQLGGVFAIYELLPAFIFSLLVIIIVSLITKAPSKEIYEDFEAVKHNRGLDEMEFAPVAACSESDMIAERIAATKVKVIEYRAAKKAAEEADAPIAENAAPEAAIAEEAIEEVVEEPVKEPVKKVPLKGHTYFSYESFFAFRKKKNDDEKPF